MRVYGHEISDEQLQAGRAAMCGQFRMLDVVGALERAGVPGFEVSSRAGDRLLQKERSAGHIRAVNHKLWEAVSEPR